MSMPDIIRSFRPHAGAVTFAEKLRSGVAGGVAILLLAVASNNAISNGRSRKCKA